MAGRSSRDRRARPTIWTAGAWGPRPALRGHGADVTPPTPHSFSPWRPFTSQIICGGTKPPPGRGCASTRRRALPQRCSHSSSHWVKGKLPCSQNTPFPLQKFPETHFWSHRGTVPELTLSRHATTVPPPRHHRATTVPPPCHLSSHPHPGPSGVSPCRAGLQAARPCRAGSCPHLSIHSPDTALACSTGNEPPPPQRGCPAPRTAAAPAFNKSC